MNKQLFENLEALRRFISAKGSVYHEYAPALEAACNELDERATQPAQERCCEHDSDCAVHNAPAYPVGPCDCTLSEKPAQDLTAAQQENADFHQWWESSGHKAAYNLTTENACHATWQERARRVAPPAQDQVAAVRAVPDDQINRIAGRNGLYRAMTPDDQTCKSMVKRFVGEILAAAAPSPQPELNGSIDTPKFITTARVGKAVITPRGMEVIGEDIISFSPAPQPAESVDTPEFRKLVDAAIAAAPR